MRTKICSTCGKEKKVNQFHKHPMGRLGRASKCKDCRLQYNRKYVREHKDLARKWKRDWYRKVKQQAVEYKGSQCSVCGYDKCMAALEFHHLNPDEKDFNITQNIRKSTTLDSIKKELDKCILVCANCHREAHYGGS